MMPDRVGKMVLDGVSRTSSLADPLPRHFLSMLTCLFRRYRRWGLHLRPGGLGLVVDDRLKRSSCSGLTLAPLGRFLTFLTSLGRSSTSFIGLALRLVPLAALWRRRRTRRLRRKRLRSF